MPQVATTQDLYAEQLASVPQIGKLGTVFKSSPPVELTESETEYVVRCVKHVFPNNVVFQVGILYKYVEFLPRMLVSSEIILGRLLVISRTVAYILCNIEVVCLKLQMVSQVEL